jgi:hypothetical protein
MKVDAYTKIVLSLIAVCLVWLCFKNVTLTESAAAQVRPAPQEVVIVGIRTNTGFLPVGISAIAPGTRLPVVVTGVSTPDQVLPVKIWGATQPVPVSIQSVKQGTPWDALSIKTAPTK